MTIPTETFFLGIAIAFLFGIMTGLMVGSLAAWWYIRQRAAERKGMHGNQRNEL